MEFTKERLLKIQSWSETYEPSSNVMLPAEEAEELARIALAAMGAEPVFFITVEGDDWTQAGRIPGSTFDFNNLPDGINKLYTAPPAPVSVPDEMEPTVEAIKRVLPTSNPDEYAACLGADMWNACRAAMINHSENERDMVERVSQPYKLPVRVTNALTLSLQAMEFMGDTLNNLDAVCEEDVEFVAPAFEAVRAALAGNSPVIPDGWQLVPVEPTPEMGRAALFKNTNAAVWKAMLAAAPQQEGK
jgi:hypothetical protein|nr:MAG TPA: hypothetical protein [Caudoviricetes sp.]